MSVKEEADALVAQADTLRSRLLEDRKRLLTELSELDEVLRRLPGARQHPSPVSLDEWRLRKRALQVTDVGREGVPIDSRDILHATAMYYGLTVADLKGPARHASVTRARHVAMWVSRKVTAESFPELGMTFGSRDHTTVIAAVRKIDEQTSEDAELRDDLATIEKAVREAQDARKASAPVDDATPAGERGEGR